MSALYVNPLRSVELKKNLCSPRFRIISSVSRAISAPSSLDSHSACARVICYINHETFRVQRGLSDCVSSLDLSPIECATWKVECSVEMRENRLRDSSVCVTEKRIKVY
jgi:hypothetical protein